MATDVDFKSIVVGAVGGFSYLVTVASVGQVRDVDRGRSHPHRLAVGRDHSTAKHPHFAIDGHRTQSIDRYLQSTAIRPVRERRLGVERGRLPDAAARGRRMTAEPDEAANVTIPTRSAM